MRKYCMLAMRIVLGAVFVYAAYTKLRDPWMIFAMSIDSYKLLPEWGVTALARSLPWFELGLGLMLISGILLRWSSAAGAGLMGVFFAIMAVSYARGLEVDCGCFGPGEALGPKTLIRDGALLGLAVALAVLAMRRQRVTESESPSIGFEADRDPIPSLLQDAPREVAPE